MNASVSVWMGSLDGHAWFELDADRTHPAASTLKLALLVAAHRAVERGQIALDDDIAVHETFASAGEGETYDTTEEYDNDPQPWELIGGTSPPLPTSAAARGVWCPIMFRAT